MPFSKISVQEELRIRKQNSAEFERLWDESKAEYRLIEEMIRLRKQEELSQSELAKLVGNKQQVISRIEKRQNSPSLETFCKILAALGYELQIVKKNH